MVSKNKICIECGRDDLPHFSNKRCYYCARKSYFKPKQVVKTEDKSELDNYYTERIKQSEIEPFSFESGKTIYNITRKNICHLLPKRTYKSVSAHPENFVLLTFEEHTRFDNLLDKFRFKELASEFPRSFEKLLQFVKTYEKILENKKLKEELLNYEKIKVLSNNQH